MRPGQHLFHVNPVSRSINPFALASKIKRPLLLDGATGSLLQRSGLKPDPNLWFSHLNLENPQSVINVHKSYLNAGADIITTNTFRTNPIALRNTSGYNPVELIKQAVMLVNEATGKEPVFIAGSNPPAEDSYQAERKVSKKELELNHKEHIQLLMENGCHFILNETQSHFDEIKIISEFCSANEIPYIISLFFDSNFRLLSGEPVIEAVSFIRDHSPLAVGFNCISIEIFKSFLAMFSAESVWGFYLNYGLGKTTDEEIINSAEPGTEKNIIRESLKKDVSFIGGCCGSGPEHIKRIKTVIDGNNNS